MVEICPLREEGEDERLDEDRPKAEAEEIAFPLRQPEPRPRNSIRILLCLSDTISIFFVYLAVQSAMP